MVFEQNIQYFRVKIKYLRFAYINIYVRHTDNDYYTISIS